MKHYDDTNCWNQSSVAIRFSCRKRFLAEYTLEPKSEQDPNKYFNLLYNLKQEKKPIVQYVSEAKGLCRKCPMPLKDYMGFQLLIENKDPQRHWRTR